MNVNEWIQKHTEMDVEGVEIEEDVEIWYMERCVKYKACLHTV